MDKKIEPGCFRKLEEEEARILVMRHGSHNKNMLTEEAIKKCLATGVVLKKSGIDIAAVYSSPSLRAITTAIKTTEGYGKTMYIYTKKFLADMGVENPQVLADLKAEAKARNLSGDPGLAKVAYDPKGEFLSMMKRRGTEGSIALRDIADDHRRETCLVPSHGVARIEPMIIALSYKDICEPKRLAVECQIIELILNGSKLVEEKWLEPVNLATTEVVK